MALPNQADDGQDRPPPPTRAQILSDVMTLAMKFSTCCEAFNLIHPHNHSDHHQKVALTKLGIQQGRLLIWGDVMGISSPPAKIATHMIPSHPGVTNPDPTMPINFAVRDPRLDQPEFNARVRAALDQIAGRPSNMSRETLMLKYGLKSPKNFSATTHAALDSNRLEAFREKFALLKDLVRQTGVQGKWQRAGSMTLQKWTVRHSDRFDDFVALVRDEVDGLIDMMGVKEQVDRGMKTDIKSMAWHPDLSVPGVRADWDKLKFIREAVAEDYPEYEETADRALRYISDELREHQFPGVKLTYTPPRPPRRRSSTTSTTAAADASTKKPLVNVESKPALSPSTSPTVGADDTITKPPPPGTIPTVLVKEKKPSLMSKLGLKSWGRQKNSPRKRNTVPTPKSPRQQGEYEDPPRSFSEDIEKPSFEYQEELTLIRSKSLSAVPSPRARRTIETVLAGSSGPPASTQGDAGKAGGGGGGKGLREGAARGEDSNANTTTNPDTTSLTTTSTSKSPPPNKTPTPPPQESHQHDDAEVHDHARACPAVTRVDTHNTTTTADLTQVETVKSLVDRHDMYRDLGRLETSDIRQKSKAAALGC
ncbi:hypothetical protein DM02DRAFT_618207 [Periconia macrospinosa]|uniref:Prion-inhibition and propagation HeLo domain-containing protein n=1 Tax=Periconia macrospinosa TaxID=97972 RepID=A0A2V1DBQ1_9PLEO|nr:hypothetical protein DM02DRAFT_618207 [Periconia macrospinosa]